MNDKVQNLLDKTAQEEQKSIPKQFFGMVFPSLMSMGILLLYNLMDTFFIAHTGNPDDLAGVSLAVPLSNLSLSVTALFGMSGAVAVSRFLGAKKVDEARKAANFSLGMSSLFGLITMLLIYFFREPIIHILGGVGSSYESTLIYVQITNWSVVFSVFSITMGNLTRAMQQPKHSFVSILYGALVNLVLDAVFILWFEWGIAGAAWATLLGNMASFIYYVRYLKVEDHLFSFNIKEFFITTKNIYRLILSIGVPGAISMFLPGINFWVMNLVLTGYGVAVVGAYGITSKFVMICSMVVVAYAKGAEPLMGYFVGARNIDRSLDVLKFGIFSSVLTILVLGLIIFLGVPYVIPVFSTDPQISGYAIYFTRVIVFSMVWFAVYMPISSFLRCTGYSFAELILSTINTCFIYWFVIKMLEKYFGLNGVVWASQIVLLYFDLAFIIFLLCVLPRIRRNFKPLVLQEDET